MNTEGNNNLALRMGQLLSEVVPRRKYWLLFAGAAKRFAKLSVDIAVGG